ncbi:MAG: hypothetical protein Q4F66_04955 [Clostridium sp.]|nr:hypothetical protein [Clostridium sp.]
MINLLNCIADSLVNHKRYKDLLIDNLSIDIYSRNIYINSRIYDEYTMELVLLIEDGEWFDKTVKFEIVISSFDSEIKVKSGYGEDFIKVKYKDYRDITDFIVNEIVRIKNKNFKYIRKII